MDKSVVNDVISLLSKEFGKEAPLTIRRGNVHDYLGMTLDYSISGKVKIIMSDYIFNILHGLPEDMDGESPTPAANYLFDINMSDPTLLPRSQYGTVTRFGGKMYTIQNSLNVWSSGMWVSTATGSS